MARIASPTERGFIGAGALSVSYYPLSADAPVTWATPRLLDFPLFSKGPPPPKNLRQPSYPRQQTPNAQERRTIRTFIVHCVFCIHSAILSHLSTSFPHPFIMKMPACLALLGLAGLAAAQFQGLPTCAASVFTSPRPAHPRESGDAVNSGRLLCLLERLFSVFPCLSAS